jgi:hypothetical protein
MTQFEGMAKGEIRSRLGRLPMVLLLTVGLLMSLIHCTGCGPAFAKSDSPLAMSNADSASPPVAPEQMLPCHSGHCLSHVTAQPVTAAVTAADEVVRLLVSGREQFPAAIAGLSLFKPPRA